MTGQYGLYTKEQKERGQIMKILQDKKKYILLLVCFISLILILLGSQETSSTPIGPNITYIKNETAPLQEAGMLNTTGGSITTMVLNATTQDTRWKAYVGNITGTLVLDDAAGYTIFDWSITNLIGEVYATRSSSPISWSNINCSTDLNITNEEIAINHTSNPNDNISTTFSTKDHKPFYVGETLIAEDSCYSIHTFVNETNQSVFFEEVLLHDKTSVVYAALVENDATGYNPNETYDFQMIVPEVGAPSWQSSTAYYFYVELI
jgi:hypothetical protein